MPIPTVVRIENLTGFTGPESAEAGAPVIEWDDLSPTGGSGAWFCYSRSVTGPPRFTSTPGVP